MPKGKISKSDISIIHRWQGEANSKDYIAKIKKSDSTFIGILDFDLTKQGYGFLSLPDNEKYFGFFTEDLKSKHGIYKFPDKINDDKIEREFYFGLFNEGKIYNHGVYLWIKEDKNVNMFNNFDDADFRCFIGNLNEKHFIEGTFMTKEGDKYNVYHGKFNENNEKEGNDAFYYNSEKDELIYGKAVKNRFVEGYICSFDEEGHISNGIYVIFDEDGKVKSYKKRDEIQDDTKAFEKMFDFRNKIMDQDYFGQIFKTFQETMNFINTDVNFESFDSPEKYPKLIAVTYNFNKIKIKDEIEGVLAKYA
jgi:hypothetical protein